MVALSLAVQMAEAAVSRAAELGAAVSVAVVDAGGNLVCFQRTDGAEIAGPTLAVDKAYTAVAHRVSTAELTSRSAPDGDLAGLHSNGGGRYVVFGGGLPCRVNGEVVGGVGASGGTVEQDEAIAAAAVAAFGPTAADVRDR
jgi:uncharacterized protein GlcG (DUF336 family)